MHYTMYNVCVLNKYIMHFIKHKKIPVTKTETETYSLFREYVTMSVRDETERYSCVEQ